jgi:fido (protein-threonine AMPylation protein)
MGVVMAVPARHIRAAGGKVLDVWTGAGLRGLAEGTVAAVLAELYVDLHVLRPFQAGNDEAITVFLGELADDAGYRSDWAAVPPAALTAAGDTGDPDPLHAVLQDAVHHIDPTGKVAGRNAARSMPWPTRSARSPTTSGPPTDPAPPG